MEELSLSIKKNPNPKYNFNGRFYKMPSYLRRSAINTARIKIFHKNDWVWLDVELNNQDVKYIEAHCKLKKEYVPTLKIQ